MSAAQARDEVASTAAHVKETRAAAALALADARRDPYNRDLATRAITAERTAHDAENAAKTAKAAERSFAIYHALTSANEANEVASKALPTTPPAVPSVDMTVLELDADKKLRAAKQAAIAADAAIKAADAKPDDEPEAKPAESKPAESKPKEKTAAEKELDKLKAGKLIRWGITGGVAPAFYQPLNYAKHAASVPGMGALTYVLFLPGYWRDTPEQNIYCANHWSGSENEAAASRAADDRAVDRAKLIVDRLLASEKAGALKTGAATEIMCTDGHCLQDERGVAALASKVNAGGDDADAARTTLTAIVQRSTFDWTSGISASCRDRMFGMWFGFPLKYTATVPHQVMTSTGSLQIRRDRLDVQPIFATGLGFSPNAYVSLLAGISLGKVNLPPAKDKDDEIVVSFLFGIGGNLDLLGFLTK